MSSLNESVMQQYSLMDEEGKAHTLEAIDDTHATGLCQKRYPGQQWKLYRTTNGQNVQICDGKADCKEETA